TDNFVTNVKLALANGLIVSVGVNLTESFQAGSALNYGVWAPTSTEKSIGGHAMCVIGYDDSKYGGAFEVMNSWGTGYGENGFVWIKYNDFKKYVQEAYIIQTTDFQ
ncbi:MAG: C1 family peptidase, partial [Bacteroidota bacterium]